MQARLTHALGDVAFGWTGWAAAQQLAPFVTQLPILHLRVDERYAHRDLAPRLRDAGLTVTDDAGRIELWRTPSNAFSLTTLLRLAPSSPGHGSTPTSNALAAGETMPPNISAT